ncbi:hypothetical protein HPP92_004737 [Vanilla planifolia]|uniref:Plant UBX domain-containing protein 4 n=1 Tax=Vanilla planifolia TaxID=51239 RepID=A0A835RLM0_VANPL|nr:hypothetical protein HPP92_004737 [Vanilla planifolia]
MELNVDRKLEDLVDSFCGITSCTREEALFFLESHNWLIETALLSYFENSADGVYVQHQQEQRQTESVAEDPPIPLAASAAEPFHSQPRSPLLQQSTTMSSSGDKKPASRTSGTGPAIRTLADLNRRSSVQESDSDSDEPQEYYTGGEKSGMLVQDPTRANNNVDAIFEQARQMGAIQGPFVREPSAGSRSFTGTGRVLSGETVPSAAQPPENIVHDIHFWRNGFTVDEGPLRRFDDLANGPFLESIRRSECPKELEPHDRRSAVHVNLVRRDENCPEPVKRLTPFQGVGRTLGEGSSATASPSSAPPPSTFAPTPFAGLSVDGSLPSTSIQLRLADGTRMVSRFNLHHTVGDIRSFIDASRPGAAGDYRLQTVGFPPKELTDVAQTIEQAGLANSVVIQKL